jgi:hypothetical protein
MYLHPGHVHCICLYCDWDILACYQVMTSQYGLHDRHSVYTILHTISIQYKQTYRSAMLLAWCGIYTRKTFYKHESTVL